MAKNTPPTMKPNDQNSQTLLQAKIDELDNKWKRALADYQNLEKRIEQEKEELTKFLGAGLIEKLLTVLDDLERACHHLNDKGLALIQSKFKSVLTSEGIVEIEAQKQIFDPVTMDCADLVIGPDNQVVEVIQKGYLLHGRVLRPAKVKVGRGGPTPTKKE
jgi:molecular chaperone GrpE